MRRRRYPRYPIPGVAGVVVGHDGLLLVKRDKPPSEGLWSVPGGVIETGETQEQALVREVKEETGISVQVLEAMNTIDLISLDEEGKVEYHYVLSYFLAKAKSGTIKPESRRAEVKWFALDELPEYEMHPRVYDIIQTSMKKLVLVMATF